MLDAVNQQFHSGFRNEREIHVDRGQCGHIEARVVDSIESYDRNIPRTVNAAVGERTQRAERSRIRHAEQSVETQSCGQGLDDAPIFNYYTKHFKIDGLKGLSLESAASDAVLGEPYSYLLFPKDEQQLVDDVNKAFKQVIKDGDSKQINEKWFGEDLTPTDEN